MQRPFSILLFLILTLLALSGCDAGSRHAFLSAVFEGYPRLPPKGEYCAEPDTDVSAIANSPQTSAKTPEPAARTRSEHLPYAEKNCSGCHDWETTTGLRVPPQRLCFVCHPDFSREGMIHGPVAVGECLACHKPHHSTNPALLVYPKDQVCEACHKEDRQAEGMHARVRQKDLVCVDCHDPHFGDQKYFLK